MKQELGVMLTIFVMIVLGITLLNPISNDVAEASLVNSVVNESFTGITGTAVSLTYDDLVAISAVANQSRISQAEDLIWAADLSAGTITINSSAGIAWGNGTFFINYTYYHDDYIRDSASRSIMGLIPILLAVVIVVLGVVMFKRMYPEGIF